MWLQDLESGKGWRWHKRSSLPKGCQWNLKERQANTHKQDRALQLMGAGYPGASTHKHLENRRKEKEAELQEPPGKLQGKVISVLNSSMWPAAPTELTPTCGHRPAFRCLLCKTQELLFCIAKIQVSLPEWLKSPTLDQATASTFSTALFTSCWKNGHPQVSKRP